MAKYAPRLFFAAALGLGFIQPALSQFAHAEKWDMPTPYPETTFHTKNIRDFVKEVSEKTNSGLEITVHSGASLIKHGDIRNAVRSGQVPIGEFFLSTLANENPIYGLDSEPFIATTYEDAKKLWQAQKPAITKLLARQNLIPLFSVAWPPQNLFSNKEIKTIADLKGLKFRAYNPTLERFAVLAGTAPVQIEVPDLPQAFSTGQVEAMITSSITGSESNVWDYITYFTPINAWVARNLVVVNKSQFEALDKATQKAVLEAAADAEKNGWEMSVKENEIRIAEMRNAGMHIVEPSPELMKELQDIGVKMQEDWQKRANADAKAALQNYYDSK